MDARPCPVCALVPASPGWEPLAEHLVAEAAASDARHVMWMNRNVTKFRTPAPELAVLLEAVLGRGGATDGSARVRR